MSTTTAYGSITIVDVTDIGEFSVYPMSNSPLSVVYDPNQNTYSPNWATNNLKLTPMVYYAGKQLTLGTSGLTVEWKRKDGIGADSVLQANETISNNELIVSANKLGDSSSGLITYICTANYVEPESQTPLAATGQITFSLIKNATNVKQCSITGENVFKYNTNGVLTNTNESGYLTLTAVINNVSITQWQYKTASGEWEAYPVKTGQNTSNTSDTLNVYASDTDVFVNDIATIRVITNDNSVYDMCTMVKLKDGAPGSATVNAVLSNDDQWIACDSSKNPIDPTFAGIESTITVFEGGVDVTSTWTITCTPTGATGSYNANTFTYSVSGISQDNAKIEFKCTKQGFDPIYKNFSLTKLTAAKDGETPIIYSISPSTLATNRTVEGVYTPASVIFAAYSKEGNNARQPYNGFFKIFENDSTDPVSYSTQNEQQHSYTFAGSNLKSIRCELYKAGGFTELVDTQTVVVTSDGNPGDPGEQGPQGEAATNVVLGNQADIIPCNNDGSVKSDMTLTIPFTGYLGTAKVACTVAPTGLPSGITVKTNTDGTTSTSGKLELFVTAVSKLGYVDSGTITLTFTCNGTTILHYYQWSKSIQASNAILFEIYAPKGNIISNGENDVDLQARLMDGSIDNTSAAAYVWKKYEGGTYTTVAGATDSLLTIQPSAVSGYASYQCIATYGSKEYTAYYAVIDKSDPIQAHVYSSIGTQILNGQGCGAVYVKIFRNGEEIDPIKSEVFSETAPANPTTGDFYYHLDAANNTVTLMKYSGSAWDAATGSDLPTATYTYTFRDKNGDITTYNGQSSVTGKVLYIDGELINKKIVIDVAVTI